MLGVYLIIYVYILEQLPEHCIFRVNLGSVINIFTVLGLIFVSCGHVLKTCHITIKVPRFNRTVHTTIFFI